MPVYNYNQPLKVRLGDEVVEVLFVAETKLGQLVVSLPGTNGAIKIVKPEDVVGTDGSTALNEPIADTGIELTEPKDANYYPEERLNEGAEVQ